MVDEPKNEGAQGMNGFLYPAMDMDIDLWVKESHCRDFNGKVTILAIS